MRVPLWRLAHILRLVVCIPARPFVPLKRMVSLFGAAVKASDTLDEDSAANTPTTQPCVFLANWHNILRCKPMGVAARLLLCARGVVPMVLLDGFP